MVFLSLKVDLMIQEQLTELIAEQEMGQKEKDNRKQLIAKLTLMLAQTFPGCNLLPFGSSESGLATRQSNLDLYLELPSVTGITSKQQHFRQQHSVHTKFYCGSYYRMKKDKFAWKEKCVRQYSR